MRDDLAGAIRGCDVAIEMLTPPPGVKSLELRQTASEEEIEALKQSSAMISGASFSAFRVTAKVRFLCIAYF